MKARLVTAGVGDVTVFVRDGVAELHGRVGSRDDAGKAIRTAMTSKGVDQVISYLEWPQEKA